MLRKGRRMTLGVGPWRGLVLVLLVTGSLCLQIWAVLRVWADEEVRIIDDWTHPKSYPLEMLDPTWPPHTKISPIRVSAKTGEPVSKELVVYNHSPQAVEDVVLRVGLSKSDRFPPTKLPAPIVFTPLPKDWQFSPREVRIGTLQSEEERTVNFSACLDKVGRYDLLFLGIGTVAGGENETVLQDGMWIELERGKGHSSRIMLIRLMGMGMLAACAAILILKQSHLR